MNWRLVNYRTGELPPALTASYDPSRLPGTSAERVAIAADPESWRG